MCYRRVTERFIRLSPANVMIAMTHAPRGRFFHASTAAILIALLPVAVGAQTCMGTAPFSAGATRVGAVASYNRNASSVGASLGLGKAYGLFANASLSRLSIDVATGPAPAFAAIGGYSFDIDWPRDVLSFQLCPFAGYESVDGPEVDLGPDVPLLHVRSHAYRGGLALGGTVFTKGRVSLVPSGSVSYVTERATTWQDSFSSETLSADYGLAEGGFGVVIKGIYTVQVMVSTPFRIKGSVPITTVGLALGMNFGTPDF
jgi:hypothetical protein